MEQQGTTPQSTLDLRNLFTLVERRDPGNELLLSIYNRHGKNKAEEVIKEIRRAGSNTITTKLGGKPVNYDVIVRDVALKMGVPEKELTWDVPYCESLILAESVRKCWDSMDKKERGRRLHETGGVVENAKAVLANGASALSGIIQAGGLPAAKKALKASASVLVGKQIGMGRLPIIAAPVALMFAAMLGIFILAGPEYKKTMPTVVEVAMLRMEVESQPDKYSDSMLRRLWSKVKRILGRVFGAAQN